MLTIPNKELYLKCERDSGFFMDNWAQSRLEVANRYFSHNRNVPFYLEIKMPKGFKGFQKGNKIGIGNQYNKGRIRIKKGIIIKCQTCSKLFYAFPSRIKIGKGKVCSKECTKPLILKSLIGRHCSLETKKKIGKNKEALRKYFNSPKGILQRKNLSLRKKGIKPKFDYNKTDKEAFSQAIKRGLKDKIRYGKKAPYWKGGITPLHEMIRGLEKMNIWKNQVFVRDNYTCQECFSRGIKLNAHHKNKSFSQLLQEFLQTYSQFSPIEDKETLIRLAITYEPFWNVNNGETLCENCHNETRKGSVK